MTTPSSRTIENQKILFKVINRFMLLMWRLGMGAWVNISPSHIGRILVLTHTGRRSGLKRRTPVNYTQHNADLFCVAALGKAADWYRNILANPEVEVWLPDGWWAGRAEPFNDPEINWRIMRQLLLDSGFAVPLFAGIHPKKMDEAQVEQLTHEYCLVRIQRTCALTGRGGPGDLSWVWPAIVQGMLLFWLLKCLFRKRRRQAG